MDRVFKSTTHYTPCDICKKPITIFTWYYKSVHNNYHEQCYNGTLCQQSAYSIKKRRAREIVDPLSKRGYKSKRRVDKKSDRHVRESSA